MTHPPDIDERIKTLKQQLADAEDKRTAKLNEFHQLDSDCSALRHAIDKLTPKPADPDYWDDLVDAYRSAQMVRWEEVPEHWYLASTRFQLFVDSFVSRLRARFSPPPADVDSKTPAQWFTAGPMRYACDVGWHSAKGQYAAAKLCYDAAMKEAQHLPAAPRDADTLAEKIWQMLYDEFSPGPATQAKPMIAALIRDHDATGATNG